ncbi:MAG: Formate dehydrogenase, cytochrome b556(fdo) subunit, partial [Pseudomonadota bacterium]
MRHFFLTLGLALAALGAVAQTQAPAAAPSAAPAAANAPASADNNLGVKSANIFQLSPSADADPKYKDQSNAERAQVQPGNNAPMWRAVG